MLLEGLLQKPQRFGADAVQLLQLRDGNVRELAEPGVSGGGQRPGGRGADARGKALVRWWHGLERTGLAAKASLGQGRLDVGAVVVRVPDGDLGEAPDATVSGF